jgi:hypothetical protein
MDENLKAEGTAQETTSNSEEVKTEDKSEETKVNEEKSEETEESEDEELGEGEEETLEKPQRTAKYVPYDKLKTERQKVKELKAKVEELSKARPSVGNDEAIEKLSQKYPEVGKEFIQDMISAAREGHKLPSDVVEKLQRLEARDLEIAQEKGFDKEYQKLIKEVPEADNPKVRAKLKTLAFTEEFAKAPLKAIFYGNPDEFGAISPKKSAEPSKGGQSATGDMTFDEVDNLPPDEKAKAIRAMDSATYEKFREHLQPNKWNNK